LRSFAPTSATSTETGRHCAQYGRTSRGYDLTEVRILDLLIWSVEVGP